MEFPLSSLPDVPINKVASFLDMKTLKAFSRVTTKIHEEAKRVISRRTIFKARNNYMIHNARPKAAVPIRNVYLGRDWEEMYALPLRAFSLLFGLRKQSWGMVESIQIDMSEVNKNDLEELLQKAKRVKFMSFGGRPSHPTTNGYKTLVIHNNTSLGEAVNALYGFQKIVVKPCGPSTPQFKVTLQKLVNLNATTLKELDLTGHHGQFIPIELPSNLELESLSTTASMSTFLWDVPNIHCLQSLQCFLTNQVPIWKFLPWVSRLSLDVCFDGWTFEKVSQFFPNLAALEIRSMYRQCAVAEKTTIADVRTMKGQSYGTMALENFIAPQLQELEITPITFLLNQHLARHSKQLKVIRQKGDLFKASRENVVRDTVRTHTNLEYLRLTHDATTCACKLKIFLKPVHKFLMGSAEAKEVTIEFFFEIDEAYQPMMNSKFFDFEGCTVENYGNSMRLNLVKDRDFRVIIKFVRIAAFERDMFQP